jgi:hypothetical protein
MAKSKPKHNQKRKWLIITGAIVIAAIVYFARDIYLDRQDREKFKRLETAAEAINSRLVNDLSLELAESRQYCYFADEKWGSGSLFCVNQRYYPPREGSDSLENFGIDSEFLSSFNADEIYYLEELGTSFQIADADCFLRIRTVDSLSLAINVDPKERLLELQCSGIARNAHYPLSSI